MIAATLIAAALTACGALATYELKEWFPRIVKWALWIAVRRLPKKQRSRFQEEWQAHLSEVPGAVAKIYHCFGFIRASNRMFPRWQRAVAHQRAVRAAELKSRLVIRLFDVVIAWSAIIAMAPLFLGVALACRMTGPVFQYETRIGRNGRPFKTYRFRVKAIDMERAAHPEGFSRGGRLISQLALDELPELLAVVKGDMSIVGPRPSSDGVPSIKPGLSGKRSHDATLLLGRHLPPAQRVWFTTRAYFSIILMSFVSIWRTDDDLRD